jgi:brefeldin A-inhibited guanine nucleotide-exchange protein
MASPSRHDHNPQLNFLPIPSSFSVILTALQGTIGTGSTSLVVIALDCLGKLISYNYVSHDPKAMESVVDLICECFVGEGTDEKIQLQIIKVRS